MSKIREFFRGLFSSKSLSILSSNDLGSDVESFGNKDLFVLIAKAWSAKEGWMKSTKAMQINKVGCVIQVTTQQGDNVSESVTFAPNCIIKEHLNDDGEVVSRNIVSTR